MGKEEILSRICADAEEEGAEIERIAEERAAEIIAAANVRAQSDLAETEAELAEYTQRMLNVNAAAARLDCAKILLAEKRRVIDTVYARALEKLLTLGERESVELAERLLSANAEEGDEIVFDEGFAYTMSVVKLPILKERSLAVSRTCANLGGGFVLRGKHSDKDLSYPALLKADMDAHQAELAAKLFND